MALGEVFAWLILSLRDGWVDNGPRGERDLHARQRGEARAYRWMEITAASSSVKLLYFGSIDTSNPKSNWHLISPHSIIYKSNATVVRM